MKSVSNSYIFRGRKFTQEDIQLIKQICEVLNWRQPNGNLKDVAMREVLLRMNNKGLITLTPK